MKTYTYTEARQQLAGLLEVASREGKVQIRRRDGRLFLVQPIRTTRSPLDVPAVETDVTLAEILDFIREGREGREAGSAGMMVRERVQPPQKKSAKRKRSR